MKRRLAIVGLFVLAACTMPILAWVLLTGEGKAHGRTFREWFEQPKVTWCFVALAGIIVTAWVGWGVIYGLDYLHRDAAYLGRPVK